MPTACGAVKTWVKGGDERRHLRTIQSLFYSTMLRQMAKKCKFAERPPSAAGKLLHLKIFNILFHLKNLSY